MCKATDPEPVDPFFVLDSRSSKLCLAALWCACFAVPGGVSTMTYCSIYLGICKWLQTIPREQKPVWSTSGTFPRWSWSVQLFHFAIFMPALCLAMVMDTDFDAVAGPERIGGAAVYARQIYYCMCGSMIHQCFTSELTVAFVFHHVVAVAGCCLCLNMPAWFGGAARFIVVAELGSLAYAATVYFPQTWAFIFHVCIILTTDWYCGLRMMITLQEQVGNVMPLWMLRAYQVFGFGLFIFRCAGVVLSSMAIQDRFRTKPIKKH